MNLVLDPGGTRLKFARASKGQLQSVHHISWSVLQERSVRKALLAAAPWMEEVQDGLSLHVLNRHDPPAAPFDWRQIISKALSPAALTWNVLDPFQGTGFELGYTSGRPGSDRIAAAVACQRKDPGGSFVIIDAGTCITIDLLSPGMWRGGAILPGLRLQAAAMKHAGLPELEPDAAQVWPSATEANGALGTNTLHALAAGIPFAAQKSTEAIAREFKALDPCAQVIITGGDAHHFDGVGGWRTFADPNLVLQGCATLLNERNP